MGKILQIRVIATTFRPEDVHENWPRLSAMAWPHPPQISGPPLEQRGVLELAGVLHDRARFVYKDGELDADLLDGLGEAARLKSEVEAALGDWDPERAHQQSLELEKLFGRLERLAPEVAFVVSKPDGKEGADGGRAKAVKKKASAKKTAASVRIANFFKALIGRR